MREYSITWAQEADAHAHEVALGISSGPCAQAAITRAAHDWTLSPDLLRAEPLPPLGSVQGNAGRVRNPGEYVDFNGFPLLWDDKGEGTE